MSYVQIAPSCCKPDRIQMPTVGRLYNPGDFMTIATNIRSKIFQLLPQGSEIPRTGEDRGFDKKIKSYIKFNFDSRNDLRMHERVARLSQRCWDVLLEAGTSLTHSTKISSYTVRWMNASMPEEKIYATLCDLKAGRKKFKDLMLKQGNPKASGKNESDSEPQPLNDNVRSALLQTQLTKATAEKGKLLKEVDELKKKLHSLEQTSKREVECLNRKYWDEQSTLQVLCHKLSEALKEVSRLRNCLDETDQKHADDIAKYKLENEDLKKKLCHLKTNSTHSDNGMDTFLQEHPPEEFPEALSPEFDSNKLIKEEVLTD